MIFLIWIIIFLEIISYIIIFDVIISWLTLLWINFRPKFIADIIDPIYKNIKKIIPTSMWPIDFTPIVVIFLLIFIKWTLFIIFPELQIEVNNLIK
jgi:YggT family protein